MTDQAPGTTPVPVLLPCECEVLALLGQRRTNAEIAAHLGLGVRTVELYVSSILAKLKVASRRDAGSIANALALSSSHDGASLDAGA